MHAAIEGREWWTKRVTDGQRCEKKEAKALLRKIAEGTHVCGDPGMQFDTRSTSGTPAKAPAGRTARTLARSISSSTTRRATSPR